MCMYTSNFTSWQHDFEPFILYVTYSWSRLLSSDLLQRTLQSITIFYLMYNVSKIKLY